MLANRKTKIICTIGPASESKEMMTKLVENGMNIIRLNFSHGDFEEHGNRIRNIREVVKETGKNIAILLDTKGPEVRLGEFENGVETYEKGDMVTIVREKILGTHEKFHIQCPEIFDDVEVGGTILIDDGKMRLTILEKREGELKCRIENPGQLKSKKGCNLPGVKLSMPFISPKDDADIRFGCQMGVDYIAASFTRRKEDILAIRKILREEGKPDIQIIPKIENQEGFDNLEEILEVADGVMELVVTLVLMFPLSWYQSIRRKSSKQQMPWENLLLLLRICWSLCRGIQDRRVQRRVMLPTPCWMEQMQSC